MPMDSLCVFDLLSDVSDKLPLLDPNSHKGNMGRICVVGGSREYTGAPYFAGITALHCGADLVHVICGSTAAPVIKSYSPELIVHPILDTDLLASLDLVERCHSVVIGPGLGLSDNIHIATELMKSFRASDKPIVVDADGLSIVQKCPDIIKSYQRIILTPNVVEFSRLYKALIGTDPTSHVTETSKLASALGNVTILRKGATDVISDGFSSVECNLEGSPRRCGGQGDLLSGAASVFFYWLSKTGFNGRCSVSVAAALCASVLTRRCANLTFRKFRLSTVTSQMISVIQTAFEQLFPKYRPGLVNNTSNN